jgi:hypothetical protein
MAKTTGDGTGKGKTGGGAASHKQGTDAAAQLRAHRKLTEEAKRRAEEMGGEAARQEREGGVK